VNSIVRGVLPLPALGQPATSESVRSERADNETRRADRRSVLTTVSSNLHDSPSGRMAAAVQCRVSGAAAAAAASSQRRPYRLLLLLAGGA